VHGLQAHIDDKRNIYLQKGSLEKATSFHVWSLTWIVCISGRCPISMPTSLYR
jgi:hypothetical protein